MNIKSLKASAIPVGTQFAPSLINLPAFLKVVEKHSGDRDAILSAVWKPPVHLKRTGRPTSRRTAALPIEAARQYGLLNEDDTITPLAARLVAQPDQDLYAGFAIHILLNRGGLRVLEGIRQMRYDGLNITGDSLAEYLTSQGFNVSVHNTAINSLRLWLSKAGVFPHAGRNRLWEIDEDRVEELLGMDADQVLVLAALQPHQLAFVEAICAVGPQDEYVANEIRDLASARNPAVKFDRGSLPNDVLEPLQEAGLITYQRVGTRRGKSTRFKTTDTFNSEVLEPFVSKTVRDLDAAISGYFKKRPQEIYKDLESAVAVKKGRALEALAIQIMRLLGLRFLAWARRAKDSGYGEVDAVFMGVFGAAPTRWQVQCKNQQSPVRLEDVAKEIGLVPITRATHILFLANTEFTADAIKYAQQVMHNTALTIFLLGKSEFNELQKDGSALGRILRTQAAASLRQASHETLFSWR